jgi:hypothetical protein
MRKTNNHLRHNKFCFSIFIIEMWHLLRHANPLESPLSPQRTSTWEYTKPRWLPYLFVIESLRIEAIGCRDDRHGIPQDVRGIFSYIYAILVLVQTFIHHTTSRSLLLKILIISFLASIRIFHSQVRPFFGLFVLRAYHLQLHDITVNILTLNCSCKRERENAQMLQHINALHITN